ncbi:peroxiredoxin [Sphingomicrobium lutaoense]|uniref:thioredoxin-dependent peroxiredoxin n=1 Tax=Sphingomicrobium lutaoense TaxID=515949 RepID=A0A839Z041_9SPHN|nr:redoxin domain-containing protein [Sphingomicrobium lutaoense]MBB3764729.1 peroxiredoxin [Sphingomicrobium lutaoense]
MRKTGLMALFAALIAAPATAELPVGAKAPDFRTMGALGGQTFRLHLSEQLREGPVVLYFFPKAFTKGCTLESKAFADAMPKFRKAGARVIGLSADDLPTLKRFSTEVCRSIVPMARAFPALIDAYDVAMPVVDAVTPMTDRTSYVIGRDGTIVMVHSDMDYQDHVAKTLAAVEKLAAK